MPVVAVLVVGIVLAGVAGMFLLRGGDGGTATPAAEPAVVDPPAVDPPAADPPAAQESPQQIGDAQNSDPLAPSGGAAAVPAPPADGASEALRSHETAQEAAGWLMSLYAENQTFDFPAPMLSSYAQGYTWKQGLDATSDGPLEVAYAADANTVTLAVAEGDGRCIFGRNRPDPGWEWQTAVTDECSPANMDEPGDPA